MFRFGLIEQCVAQLESDRGPRARHCSAVTLKVSQNHREFESMATEQVLDPSLPSCRYLLSAILAMEPSDCLLSHARYTFSLPYALAINRISNSTLK